MTLLGSEHSLLIRSKFRSVLQLRLQQRRERQHLADHGFRHPLKSPAGIQEQRKSLERVKTEDCLKHKVRQRLEKPDQTNMHILQDSSAEGVAQAAQIKLKRARLADDLNERIALRPGPLELVEKNIIPLESTVKEAMKGNASSYSKQVDAFAFEEDSSNDGLSPDQERREETPGNPSSSPQETKTMDTSFNSVQSQSHTKENDNDSQDAASPQSRPCPLHQDGHLSTSGPAAPNSTTVKTKSSTDTKNRHKKPKDIKPKVKKLKYHQYIPPDQKAEKSPPPMDSAYARLLQQQQLFLQLQILSQQQQQQHHHFSYQGMHHSHLKQPNEQMSRNSNISAVTSPSLSPVKTNFSSQSNVSSMKPGLLPSNLDDLKVSELRQQLRIRGLPVSGTKTSLMERLRPFQECGNTVPTFGEITTVTFPVTPNNSMSSYQTHPSTGIISSGFYQFGSTSSTPPISPASSDLSVNGSLPDTFSDGPMSSPQFGLHPSPIHLSAEESLMSSMNSGSYQELEGIDAEKDKMLVEKQKVINELTWKLQQEQRQVEELRLQLQKQKGGPQDKTLPSQHFFGVHIKQENVSSCPFASKQMTMKAQASGTNENMGPCAAQQLSCLINNRCLEASNPSSMSSTFLSPQCSPQHSPHGPTSSPQHISLPPSPNNRCQYLLPVSPNSQGDTRSISPQHVNNRLRTGQNVGSTVCYSPNQNNLQSVYANPSDNKQSSKDAVSPKSSRKMNILQPSPQAGQKLPVPCMTFSNAPSSDSKQLPSYEDAVRQQITRSQQMDELLDVLIESGEMPAHAKDERSCGQKLTQLSVPTGNQNLTAASSHLPYENCSNNDSHLEVLLNSHSPIGRPAEIPLLKIGNEEGHFERGIDGFPGKVTEDILPSREILETSLSPMETQMSPSSAESTALQHLSFTESPWETMEWLDLTPPSSATGLGSLTTTGPSIFNTDFLDVTDLNLNNAMDLHLEQW